MVAGATRLEGGQHAETWRVDTDNPATSVVVRQFPVGDPAPSNEQRVLRALDGLGGLAPLPLGGDLDGRWSKSPTSLVGWLDGQPDITPADPKGWARELGRALAAVHAVPAERLAELPGVFDHRRSSQEILGGPLAAEVRSRWPGGARGPRGYDLGWCRLDLVLLFDEPIADEFLAAYEAEAGQAVGEMRLWDCWAVARSDDIVGSWGPNYLPFGRADLDADELRRRHAKWTARLGVN